MSLLVGPYGKILDSPVTHRKLSRGELHTAMLKVHLHLDCLLTVTSRYSPMRMGPQKSTATSLHGSLSKCIVRKGATPVTQWLFDIGGSVGCASTILSNPGNHTRVLRYSLVLVIPWGLSCASLTTFSRMELGTTIRAPRTVSPPTTAISVKMESYCSPSKCLFRWNILHLWLLQDWKIRVFFFLENKVVHISDLAEICHVIATFPLFPTQSGRYNSSL